MFLSLALVSALSFPSLAADPAVDAPREATPAERALLDTLQVAPDGTLAFRDTETAHALLGADWAAALAEMDALNARIRNGLTAPFAGTDALQEYRLKEPGTCAPAEIAWTPTDANGSNGILATAPDSDPDANCYCKNKCCFSGLCCDSGWWIFCWKYKSC